MKDVIYIFFQIKGAAYTQVFTVKPLYKLSIFTVTPLGLYSIIMDLQLAS